MPTVIVELPSSACRRDANRLDKRKHKGLRIVRLREVRFPQLRNKGCWYLRARSIAVIFAPHLGAAPGLVATCAEKRVHPVTSETSELIEQGGGYLWWPGRERERGAGCGRSARADHDARLRAGCGAKWACEGEGEKWARRRAREGGRVGVSEIHAGSGRLVWVGVAVSVRASGDAE